MQPIALTGLAEDDILPIMRPYKTQITAIYSLPEMKAAMDQELERVREAHGLKEDGRAIFERHLAHYVMAWFFGQDQADRDEIVLEGRQVMEARRRSRTPVYWPILGVEDEIAAPSPLGPAPGGTKAPTAATMTPADYHGVPKPPGKSRRGKTGA
jgi:hypothetical protein